MSGGLNSGKLVVITGASSGIGKRTALRLARQGMRVVLICRSRLRGTAAMAEIIARSANLKVALEIADLSVLGEVRAVAKRLLAKHRTIDVLINNAGTFVQERRLSADGFELQLAVNHLAPFLLTHLLRDALVAAAPARVINVASEAHRDGEIAPQTLGRVDASAPYDPLAAYSRSKLAHVMFTYGLARRLEGSGVTANCLHPGVYATKLLNDFRQRPGLRGLLETLRGYPGPDAGAKIVAWLATDPALTDTSGTYFKEREICASAPQSLDEGQIEALWAETAHLTGVSD